MGAKKFFEMGDTSKGVTWKQLGQAMQQDYEFTNPSNIPHTSHDSSYSLQVLLEKRIQLIKKHHFNSPETKDEIPNKSSQSLEKESYHKKVQAVETKFAQIFKNALSIQKKKPLTAIQEDISSENSQGLENESCHENVQVVETESSPKKVQMVQKKPLKTLQAIQEDISNGHLQVLEMKSSHENVQVVEEESSHRNDQSAQEKFSYEKVQTALKESSPEINQSEEEEFFYGNVEMFLWNSQGLENESCHENVQVVETESSPRKVQVVQKKPLKTLQAIQEDISNGHLQVLEMKSSHENVQVVEEESSHRNDQSVQEEFSYEKVQTALKESSPEINQSEEEEFSYGNVETMNEGFSCRNSQVKEESFYENDQTTQKKKKFSSLNEEVQFEKERFSNENVQAVEKESSYRNDQSVQEVFSYEKVQTASEESSQENDQNEEERSSHENNPTINEGFSSRNDQSAQEESSHENDQTQEKPSHQNVENVEEGGSNGNDEVALRQENRYLRLLKNISVEPTMWFYMMAFMFTSVVEQAFFVYKACRVDHGHSEEICLNLNDYKDIQTEVQKTVSEFQQWYNLAGHIVPIILALFFGNWSDRRGRKLPLIIGLTGKLVYSVMIVVNTLMENWDLNMVTYTAVLPMGILGGDVMIFGSCFAYLVDICSVEERTMRITILDIIYLSTMPTGIALGSYVFANVVNFSYTMMFTINACLLVLAIVYSLVRLKWQTSSAQQSLVGVNFLKDFFDIEHVKETVNMMIKRRQNGGRTCLILIMLSMCLYTFQREERSMSFLYTQLVFNWDVAKFSNFRTFQSSLFVAAMLCAMPLMKYLKLKDTMITGIGAVSHATGRLIFIVARVGKVFYSGAVVAALGPVVAPALRSMASKYVSVEERGKVFAILSVFDNAVPLISSVLYSQIYNATIYSVPNFIYWLTFITQICVLLLAIIINFAPWNLSIFICRRAIEHVEPT